LKVKALLFSLLLLSLKLKPQALIDSLRFQLSKCVTEDCILQTEHLLVEELAYCNQEATVQLIERLYKETKENDTLNYLNIQSAFAFLCLNNNLSNKAFKIYSDLKLSGIQNKNKRYVARANFGLCSYYMKNNDLKTASDLLFSALKDFEVLGDNRFIAKSYLQIAIINHKLKNNPKAIEFAKKSLDISTKYTYLNEIASAYNNLGNLYAAAGSPDISLEYYQRALSIRKKRKHEFELSVILTNIGVIFFEKGQLEQAEKYFKEALVLNLKLKNKKNVAACYLNLGGICYNKNDFSKADFYYRETLKYLNENDLALKETLYYNLGEVNFKLNNKEKAFAYQDSCMSVKDSIYSRESIKTLNEMQIKYETEKKEKENILLKREHEIEIAVATEKEKKLNVITYSITGGLIIVILFSFVLSSRLKITRQQKRIIESQKHIVDEKQKEILDSIHYAQRLQNAILAKEEDIQKQYPKSFLLYKPKDIVAGDFYFYETTETHAFYAAADCTGHGVPGALVSIVCSNALSRCVFEFDLNDPGKILDKARELVLDTFKKSGQDVKDGMDISLLVKEKSTGILKWAGANNPLWKLNSGRGVMEEIKADKQPIGLSDDPKPFTSHEIKADKNDSLYLFTDGMPDQFGGPKGKKYKYKRLEEQLIKCSDKDPRMQKEFIQNDLKEWMRNNEQVDDILLIGITI